jgi:L-alanine-DL-glutamate epimerase-like enolase superfamily enzyme
MTAATQHTEDGFRLAGLDVAAYTVPTEQPEADGTLSWSATTAIVVRPRTRDGRTGLGYAYGHECLVPLVSGLLAEAVTGIDVRDTGAAWTAMARAIRNLGRPGLVSMAIAAVDVALWDLKARCLGVPVHRLLPACRDAVPVYGSGGFTTYTDRELADQLGGWAEAGIRAVKLKVGTDRGAGWRRDLERVAVARRAVGDEVAVFVDANGAFDRRTALRFGREVAERYGVSWFEEPVSSDDLVGLAALARDLPLDVTAGEYGYHLDYFAAMLDAGAVDVLQADAGRCAGITEWLRVADLAEARHVPFSAHCGPSLHAHAATAPAGLRHVEYFHDHARVERLLFDGVLDPVDGCLRPGDAPGLGLTLRAPGADQYRVA